MTREQLFYYLKDKGMICIAPGRAYDPPYPPWYKPELTCIYHQDAKGHSIDTCDQFKSRVLQMIDAGWINVPNITKNPLPEHGANAIMGDKSIIRNFTQSAFTPEDIYRALAAADHVPPMQISRGNFCDYHKVEGHNLNECPQWEEAAHQYMQLGLVSIQKGINREHTCSMVTKEGASNQEVPFTINFPDKGASPRISQGPPLFTINRPGTSTSRVSVYPSQSLTKKAIPWTYQTKKENNHKRIEPPPLQASTNNIQGQGLTRSGRIYAKPVPGVTQGNDPAGIASKTSKNNPEGPERGELPGAEMELEKEFLSIVKKSDYDIVEQLNRTPSKISMLSLMLTSDAHRQALLKTLTEAHVPSEITPEKMVNLIDVIKHASLLSFSDEEVCPGTKALHITVRCYGFTIAKVLVDGGSALNVLPLATFQQLPVESNRIDASNMVVRAFDGTRREATGGVTLPIEIGPVTFDIPFQLMEIDAAYTMLLGRPWIHEAKAIPSTLHQKIKFIRDGKIITIKGEESMLISQPSPVPFIDSTEAALESSFQGLELEETPFQINSVAVKIMAKQGYQKGRGLGPALNGIPRCIEPKEREALTGLGYEGSKRNISHHKKKLRLDQLFVSSKIQEGEDHIAVIERGPSVGKGQLIWRSDEGTSLDNWEADCVLSVYSDK